jgi:hypothetical protein
LLVDASQTFSVDTDREISKTIGTWWMEPSLSDGVRQFIFVLVWHEKVNDLGQELENFIPAWKPQGLHLERVITKRRQ